MASQIAFNGWDLTGTSELGGKFRVTSFEGWHAVTYRHDRMDKAQQAGAWGSTGFAAALPITVRGVATYATSAAAAAERRTFVALADVGEVLMAVTDDGGSGTRTVEADSLIVSPVFDRMFSFALVATAVDPLLYGPAAYAESSLSVTGGGTGRVWPRVWPRDWGVPPGVTPGAIALSNDGTASYHPRVRIDGPVTNPVLTLVETGDQIAYNGSLAAGQYLDINAGKPREVLLGGQVSHRYKTSITGNALAVPIGGGSLTLSADSAGTGSSFKAWYFEGAWV